MSDYRIVVDPLYGDGGKGAATDYLTDRFGIDLVVRYNGGPQAAHWTLVEGRSHCHSTYGSGTRAGAETYLSPFVRFDPYDLVQEMAKLYSLGIRNVHQLLYVHKDCLVLTPYHSRMSQTDPVNVAHGTCGYGVGKAGEFAQRYPAWALRVGDLVSKEIIFNKLIFLAQKTYPHEKYADLVGFATSMTNEFYDISQRYVRIVNDWWWQEQRDGHRSILMEGAQGCLIGEKHGYKPYISSTDTSTANARKLMDGRAPLEVFGTIRSYAVRHGPGPFPTEASLPMPEQHNLTNDWQGAVRTGWLDAFILRKVAQSEGITAWFVSHLDYGPRLPEWQMALDSSPLATAHVIDYGHYPTVHDLLDDLVFETTVPIGYVADGPSRAQRGPFHG